MGNKTRLADDNWITAFLILNGDAPITVARVAAAIEIVEPDIDFATLHNETVERFVADGWGYAEVTCCAKKVARFIRPYDELSAEDQLHIKALMMFANIKEYDETKNTSVG